MRDCRIDWGPLTIAEWDHLFGSIRRSTLLQHYPYAQSRGRIESRRARHGIIFIDGERAGLVQVGEIGVLRNAVHVLDVDRGPLWFDGYGSLDDVCAFFRAFNDEFPSRFGRRRRLLPELSCDAGGMARLQAVGLVNQATMPGYETVWLDLKHDLVTLRSNLSGAWRNSLRKSERANVDVSVDNRGETAPFFLAGYEASKAEKGFHGPSAKLLSTLIAFMAVRREVLIVTARTSEQRLASILLLLHGQSATYQASWTTEQGRRLGCHNRLLWHAVTLLRDRGISDLDLGGINRLHAEGVTKFKLGLGGERVQLCGQFA